MSIPGCLSPQLTTVHLLFYFSGHFWMSATCIIFFTKTKQKTTCWLTNVSLCVGLFFWGGDYTFWLLVLTLRVYIHMYIYICIYYDMPAFPCILGDFLSPRGIRSHVACHLSSVKSFGAWVLCCLLSKKRTFTCWRVCPFALEHQFASACWCELVRTQLLTVLWTIRAVQVVGLLCCNSSFFVAVGCFGDFCFILFFVFLSPPYVWEGLRIALI